MEKKLLFLLMISICPGKISLDPNRLWNCSDSGLIIRGGLIENKEIYLNSF